MPQLIIHFAGRSTVHANPSPSHPSLAISSALHTVHAATAIPLRHLRSLTPTPSSTPNPFPIHITLTPSLRGGKGGFGAALRASGKAGGAQTTNFGACRDLNGRRLRHVNNEIRLRLWREAREKRGSLPAWEAPDPDSATASGIHGWHLAVPQWAEGLSKVKRQRLRRKTRLCENWMQGGCARGRACDFAHGEHELDEAVRAKMQAERKLRRREESREPVRRHARELVQREGAMGGAVAQGMRSAARAAREKRLERVREVGETLGVGVGGEGEGKEERKEEGVEGNGLSIDCLAGEMGIGATGEIEGRSEFATAGSPLAAVREGKWYFEVHVLTEGIVQVGFGSDEFIPDQLNGDGVGDCVASWGYDGSRNLLFIQGKERALDAAVSRWKAGDVVGCTLDLESKPKTCTFSLNGRPVSSAELDSDSSSSPALYYAAVSLNSGQAVRLNYGQRPFVHFNTASNPKPMIHAIKSIDQFDPTKILQDKPIAGDSSKVSASEPKADIEQKAEKVEQGKESVTKEHTDCGSAEIREIDLDKCETEESLGEFSLEEFKHALQKRGLKCGGTLEERKKRLFSIKGLQPHEIDRSLFAGAKNKRKKQKRK